MDADQKLDLTVCVLCLEKYYDDRRLPRFHQCHHTFCSVCITLNIEIIAIFQAAIIYTFFIAIICNYNDFTLVLGLKKTVAWPKLKRLEFHLATGLEELIFDRVVIRLNESLRIQTGPFGQLTMIDSTV